MSSSSLLALFMIALSGALVAIQAPLNAALARQTGGALLAASVSFGVGFVALAALTALSGNGSLSALRAAPLWMWLGGFCGAFYVASMVWAVPTIGVMTAIAALILGQLLASMTIDAVGAFGVEPRPIDARRALAVALVAAGVILSRR